MKRLLVLGALVLVTGCGGGGAKHPVVATTTAPLSAGATCIRATEDGQLEILFTYIKAAFGENTTPTPAQTSAAQSAVSSLESLEPRAALDIRPDLHTLTTEIRKIMAVYKQGTGGTLHAAAIKSAASNLAATCDVAAGG